MCVCVCVCVCVRVCVCVCVCVSQDLDMVAAKDAHSVMIVSDQSRCPEEADAQSLRCVTP